MKKVVSLTLLMLVASMVFSGIPNSAEAQTDLGILLKIASQAQREVKHQVSSTSSEEIKQLFREASNQVVLLEKSLQKDDPSAAKQHFLNAMKMFKRISLMISSDRPIEEARSTDVAPSSTQSNYHSDLERIKKFISSLKSTARSQSVSFEEADGLVALAERQIRENDDTGLDATIKELKGVLTKIHNELRRLASQTINDRTIKFFNDMLDRLENRNADEDLLKTARDMLSDYEQQIIDGNYDGAKQLKKDLTKIIRELYKSTQ
jgi:hypothetical protein